MEYTPEEIRDALPHFIGTTEYHKLTRLCVLTDGAHFLAKHCECFWLMDIIASYQPGLLKKGHVFQVWKLNVSDSEGNVYCGDGNGNRLRHQKILYTDFPLSTIKLYAIWNGERVVIMLPTEN
jgi:hypothetical protein